MIVHFICRGNVLRSVIAEAYLKSLQLPGVTVLSSGTVADKYRAVNIEAGYPENTRALLDSHGLTTDLKTHADQLSQDLLGDDQLVICVNALAYESAVAITQLPKSTVVWDIVDIGEGSRLAATPAQRQFYAEQIFDEITAKVDQLVVDKKLAQTL
ncbi:hypothetical protein H7097_02715 [Aeromicrobium sp.]|nr:hypothetical protein [Candidatus Saccharibacteria bacterium]